MSFLERIFGSYSKKELARLEPIKQKVLDLEPKYQAMDARELQEQTSLLRERLAAGETLDDLLPTPLRSIGRPPGAPWAKSPSPCRSSAPSSSIRAGSPR